MSLSDGDPPARRMNAALKRVGLTLAPILLVLLGWYLVATIISAVRDVPFPTPLTTGTRLAELLGGETLLDHSIYRHTADSLARWGTGFIAAACAGLLFGLAAGWWRSVERMTMTSVHVIQLIPGLAWIPVAILIFGVGERATLFMIAMTAFAAIIVARTRLLKQHPDRAVKFLNGLAKAAAFVKARPDETAELLSKATGLNPGLVKKAMARHSYTLTLDESILKSLEQTARFLESKKRIKEIPDFEKVIDARYVRQTR